MRLLLLVRLARKVQLVLLARPDLRDRLVRLLLARLVRPRTYPAQRVLPARQAHRAFRVSKVSKV